MSDDLKKRLREDCDVFGDWICGEAADRIEELEAKAMDNFQMYVDANEARIDAEAKLAQLVKAATKVHNSYWHSTDGVITGMYELEQALRLRELKGGDRG
jgi:hypothetical protein